MISFWQMGTETPMHLMLPSIGRVYDRRSRALRESLNVWQGTLTVVVKLAPEITPSD
jgi:hypothetical protein